MTVRTKEITIPQNDYGYALLFTCRDSDGVVVNITGHACHFKVWARGAPGTLLVDGTGAVLVGASGTATYTIVNGDFPNVGKWYGEFETTIAGVRSSYQSLIVNVAESG